MVPSEEEGGWELGEGGGRGGMGFGAPPSSPDPLSPIEGLASETIPRPLLSTL